MVNVPYNPFSCELEEVEVGSLAVLRSVAEGWHVEYKRESVPTKSIAKSLSAFANHYGGWIFYGIEEEDSSNYARAFPGIEKNEVGKLLDNIRNAAKDSITPEPYYEYKVLDGPALNIGLDHNRAIVIVVVPSGPDAPYIHADGKIYRRIADSSDPKSETDRFVLDNLWQRRKSARDKLATFLDSTPLVSQGEEQTSFIHLFLLNDPLGIHQQHRRIKFDTFIELMSNPLPDGVSISLDNFFTMADGFIGRDVNTNDPFKMVLTWKYFFNGNSVISCPFSSSSELNKENRWLEGYKYADEFIAELEARGHETYWVLDINPIFMIIPAIIKQHKNLLKEAGYKGEVYAKAMLENVWRRTPFLDTSAFIQFIKDRGLPVIQFESEYAPSGVTPESLLPIPDREESKQEYMVSQFAEAAELLVHTSFALGIPDIVLTSGEWYEAANRSITASKQRMVP